MFDGNREWLRIDQKKPGQNQKVWYWFEVSKKVFSGIYRQGGEDHGAYDIFMGERGFLGDDVTWWMPRADETVPEPPTFAQRCACLYHSNIVTDEEEDRIEELMAGVPVNKVNRSRKSKVKKGSGCAACKPQKHGWGPSADIKTIAEMESVSVAERWPAMAKSKPRQTWRIGTKYSWSKKWGYRKYLNEKGAREAFDKIVSKAINPYHYKLLQPDGVIVEERKAERDQ